MKKIAILASVAVVTVYAALAVTEEPSRPATASAYFLPVEHSEGRSLRYWADHPLDAVDTNAEHAVVVVHGVNGGQKDSAGRIRKLLSARRETSKVYSGRTRGP